MRLGIFGKPSDWLIASNIDIARAKELGIEIVELSLEELSSLSESKTSKAPSFKASFNQDELDKAYSIYEALIDLVSLYKLDGLTIRCFYLLSRLKTTSCLAFSLLNKEGIISSCEGDIPSLIGMMLVKEILKVSSFQANPSQIDLANNRLVLAHCTVPLDMCKSYKFDTHYESNIGVGIKGELEEKEVTIFRIDNTLRRFVLLEGRIIQNLSLNNLCRTQIEVEVPKGLDYFLLNPLGNHHLIIYGHHKKEIEKALLEKGFKEVTL